LGLAKLILLSTSEHCEVIRWGIELLGVIHRNFGVKQCILDLAFICSLVEYGD
jgi:hypothetical protein